MNLPKDLRYSKEHEWVKDEDGKVRIGITEFAQDELGDIVFVELPEVGDELNWMSHLAVLNPLRQCLNYTHLFQEKLSKLMKN